MKRKASLLLIAVLLAAAGIPAAAGEGAGDPFVIGATTALSGSFFTGMWGNNTSDIDVRTLLHAYSPVVWTMQSLFEENPTVVDDITAQTLTNGNRVYTVTLREGLTYNDGSPITAEDYLFSLLLHASPVITALGGNATGSAHIEGYDAYHAGTASAFSGLRLLSTHTFSVEVRGEYLPYFYELSMLDCTPYPIEVIAPGCVVRDEGAGAAIRNEDAAIGASLFTPELLRQTLFDPESGYASHPRVTSGPYELVAYDPQARTASFRINARFAGDHMGQKPSIDNLLLRSVTQREMIGLVSSGQVDLLNKCVTGEAIGEALTLQSEGTVKTASYPRLGFGFIAFTCERGPGQSEAVRKAIAYSLDRDAFCEAFTTLNYGRPVHGFYGIGQWMVQAISTGNPGAGGELTDAAAWAALSLDGLEAYAPDSARAERLLIEDGWTRNAQGEPFEKGRDTVRYKDVGGQRMGLTLRYGKLADSIAAQLLEDMLREPLARLGIALEVTEVAFPELLAHFYHQRERTYDLMYLGTNFTSVYDPYVVFNTAPDYRGAQNYTGYIDPQLEALALDLRKTEPGDLLGYCQKWLAFQTYWNERLPMLPLYSNIYFDVHTPRLIGYNPSAEMNWPAALLYATLE